MEASLEFSVYLVTQINEDKAMVRKMIKKCPTGFPITTFVYII